MSNYKIYSEKNVSPIGVFCFRISACFSEIPHPLSAARTLEEVVSVRTIEQLTLESNIRDMIVNLL